MKNVLEWRFFYFIMFYSKKYKIHILFKLFSFIYIILLFFVIVLKLGDAFILFKLTDKNRTLTEIINSINFIPFLTITSYLKTDFPIYISLRNLLGNIVVFIPLGFLLYKAFSNNIKIALLISFLTSFLFEIIQVSFNIGSGDIDDIILNSLGTILGIIISKIFFKLIKK